MTNLVDTSTETINMEFDAAEKAIGTEEAEQHAANQIPPEQAKAEEEQRQAEIAMATGMISTSLRFAIVTFSGVSVDDQHYTQAAESYTVLIIKYFPGGIFAFLDQFKEELAAVTTTFVLIRAVSEAKAKKAEEEKQQEQQQAQQQKQPPQTGTPVFNTGTATKETNSNG